MLIGSKRTFCTLSLIALSFILMQFISPIVLYANTLYADYRDDGLRRIPPYRYSAIGGGIQFHHELTRSMHVNSMDRVHRMQNRSENQYSYFLGPYYYDSYMRPYERFETYRNFSKEKVDQTETVDESMGKTEPAKPAKTIYTIQKGDTLYRIAKFFGTTVDLLMLENNIADPTKLQIGQLIYVPNENQDIEDWIADHDRITNVFHATLTAYTAGFESTGKTPSHPQYGITASGAKVKDNHTIAVDPNVIPLGTYVYIEGLGIRKAEDTGSAIKGNKIDVYIPDLDEAIAFGVKKNVKVYVLDSKKNNEVRIASNRP